MNRDEPQASSIAKIREAVYLGSGYSVVRDYLAPREVRHLTTFWHNHHNALSDRYDKKQVLRPGCANVSVLKPGRDRHFNHFWNRPLDAFTQTTAWQLQAFRNQIEGRPAGEDYLPLVPRYRRDPAQAVASSYRLVFTRDDGDVPDHVDSPLDHSRIQMTLLLSSYGEDYRGGFFFADSLWGSELTNLCELETLRAGDLLIFRYAQRHAVRDVQQVDGGSGFCRMLMPLDTIPVGEPAPVRDGILPDYDDAPYQSGEKRYYDDEVEQLMRIAVAQGFEPCEVYYYRGLWGRWRLFQDWQMQALPRYGLKSHHQVLDIGCGCLRLGMQLIPDLDDDHYCGMDPVPGYIDLGHRYMKDMVNTEKTYHLACDDDFGFDRFARTFDFATAHSVFTHLSFEQIERCFQALKPVMKSGGILVFTIVLGKVDREDSVLYAGGLPMTKSRHADMSFYEDLGKRIGFRVTCLGGTIIQPSLSAWRSFSGHLIR